MVLPVSTDALLATVTPTPGVGPDELVDYWPLLVRLGWFLGSFAIVSLVGWFVVAPALAAFVGKRNPNNPTLQEAIERYVGLGFVVVALLVGAAVSGFQGPVRNSALVVAAGTLALGVAGQSVIGSIVSGLALVADPEFNVGNYIAWEEGEGTVRSITLRVTRVQTPDGELVTVPNETLTERAITRPFGRGRLRIAQRVGLEYDEDVEQALAVLESVARDLDASLDQPDPEVYVDELGDEAIAIDVYFWIEDPQRRDVQSVKSEFAQAVLDRFEAADLTAGPQQTLEISGRLAVDEPGDRDGA